MAQCRSEFESAVGEELLKLEHKFIKSLVTRSPKDTSFAFFVGALCFASDKHWVYIRCMEIGRFTGVAQSVTEAIPKKNRTIIDSVLSSSDLSRIIDDDSKPRVDDRCNAFTSFHEFSASLDSNQFFGGICVESQSGEIFHSAFGLSHLKMSSPLECILAELQRSPRGGTDAIPLVQKILSDERLNFDAQVDILNSIPAQFTTTSKDRRSNRLPMYASWYLLSPKHAVLSLPSNWEQIKISIKSTLTIRSTKQSRAVRAVTTKRKDTQQSFLRRFSRVTSTIKMRLLTAHPELNVHAFKHELSPLDTFQTSIISKGHIRLVTNTGTEITVLWNKFDPIQSEKTLAPLQYLFGPFVNLSLAHFVCLL
jgi:hypothetical protein